VGAGWARLLARGRRGSPSRDRAGPSGTSESAFREKPGPLTVAGPRRIHTGFREPPRPILSCPEDAPAAPAGQLPISS